MLLAPTGLHQSCIHRTSHLMVHHIELQVPSTQANKLEEVLLSSYFDKECPKPS
jgi:hypothetical protein